MADEGYDSISVECLIDSGLVSEILPLEGQAGLGSVDKGVDLSYFVVGVADEHGVSAVYIHKKERAVLDGAVVEVAQKHGEGSVKLGGHKVKRVGREEVGGPIDGTHGLSLDSLWKLGRDFFEGLAVEEALAHRAGQIVARDWTFEVISGVYKLVVGVRV